MGGRRRRMTQIYYAVIMLQHYLLRVPHEQIRLGTLGITACWQQFPQLTSEGNQEQRAGNTAGSSENHNS